MNIRFSKMQGAGNDFVVIDETRGRLNLTADHYRFLADRHFGVGADQILSIRPPGADAAPGTDFSYVIHNNDGNQVEHCGNGARCFVRYVKGKGLTQKTLIQVQTTNRTLQLQERADGTVLVDMGEPQFGDHAVHFDAAGLAPRTAGTTLLWPLALPEPVPDLTGSAHAWLALVSMGNPHAVMVVPDTEQAPVLSIGPVISTHPQFAQGVNAGFMQIVHKGHIKLRVFERGAGETLACGTGACAAVAAGIAQGLLDPDVRVTTHGGELGIHWAGPGQPLQMSGPANFVFDGEISLPNS